MGTNPTEEETVNKLIGKYGMKSCTKCGIQYPNAQPFFSLNSSLCKRCKRAEQQKGQRQTRGQKEPGDASQTLVCTACCQEKQAVLENFHASPAGKFGLNARCRACFNLYCRERYKKQKAWRRKLVNGDRRKKLYGVTTEAYELLYREQGGVCKICRAIPTDGKSLAVDHDHKTGKFRGLLCSKCNAGIGFFKDNPDALGAAAAYLEHFDHVSTD